MMKSIIRGSIPFYAVIAVLFHGFFDDAYAGGGLSKQASHPPPRYSDWAKFAAEPEELKLCVPPPKLPLPQKINEGDMLQYQAGPMQRDESTHPFTLQSQNSGITPSKQTNKRLLKCVRTKPSEHRLLPATDNKGCVTISHNGQWIITGHKNGIVKIHSVANPEQTFQIDFSAGIQRNIGYIARVDLTRNNTLLTAVFYSKENPSFSLAIYDFDSRTFIFPKYLDGSIHKLSGIMSPGGKFMAVFLIKEGVVQVIDWKNSLIIYQTPLKNTGLINLYFIDNTHILFATYKSAYKADFVTGETRNFSYLATPDFFSVNISNHWITIAHTKGISCFYEGGVTCQSYFTNCTLPMVISNDGKTLYCSKAGNISGYNIFLEILKVRFPSGDSLVSVIKITPDDQMLIAGYSDGFIRLWNIATEQLLLELKCQTEPIEPIEPIENKIKNIWVTPDYEYLVYSPPDDEPIQIYPLHVE
ncbi:WD40 repeat domain-containing protein [Sansalvadorimonas sp. 2012CJ34-2]|uniref:WD40 repeat domain-containing protein n=1 Tax=Parendozoicomonas callyspongiae TaxID=2942213 RepID=A0ABT0PAE5_9GAMM|nr:WD40 repeat domain-containing protein [Sansalvadorimonas sp. 2012CJ34-2]MCL6268352.1 WD40 repeat domain-containing protein [Sansalvadorimonas sp. 2012CJ34-2]